MGRSTGDEHANLYMRGVNEGYEGKLLEAQDLLDILDVFGEDGLRIYLAFQREKRTPLRTKQQKTPTLRK